MTRRGLLILWLVLLSLGTMPLRGLGVGAAWAADAWKPAGWKYRLAVDYPKGEGDVAWVEVDLNNRCTVDGRDLRLVNARGEMVPFELAMLDPAGRSLLVFQTPDESAGALQLYFGNPLAPRFDSLRPRADKPAWRIQRGLLLRIYRKADRGHPPNVPMLMDAVAQATPEGAAFVPAVSLGYNPFGLSDQYFSIYSGYLSIDKPGTYAFCSASKDGSWIIVNGKTILGWPGVHGWQGAERGQKNGTIDLPKGVAHVAYLHEVGDGAQMAFMGWKPPGADGFAPIPAGQWLSVREARAGDIQAAEQALTAQASARIINTYWVRESAGLQATLVEFTSRSQVRDGKIARCDWSFGDGTTASGASVRHVYFRLGRPEVKLTVTDERGKQDAVTLAPRLFLVDVDSNYFNYGSAGEYAKAAAEIDPQTLDRADLANLARFWQGLERWRNQISVTEIYARRFPDGPDGLELLSAAARTCAGYAGDDPKMAEQFFVQAIPRAKDAAPRIELSLERAANLIWNLASYRPARELLEALRQSEGDQVGPRAATEAARRWLMLQGDLALLQDDPVQARSLYEQAQTRARKPMDEVREMVREGGYPYSVEDLIARQEYEWAHKLLDRWEDELPAQKLDGLSFFLRGKALYIAKPGPRALRYLRLAQQVAPQAVHVPEALWLEANCLIALDRYQDARAVLQRIRSEYTRSEYFDRAGDKIKFCQERLHAGKTSAPK